MPSQPSDKQYGTPPVLTHGHKLLDARIIDWRDRRADPLDLAYAFFVFLDDAMLREVFGDFTVPANTSDWNSGSSTAVREVRAMANRTYEGQEQVYERRH